MKIFATTPLSPSVLVPSKSGRYWRWLKKKLNADGVQLVSVTHDFKFVHKKGRFRGQDEQNKPAIHKKDLFHGRQQKNFPPENPKGSI